MVRARFPLAIATLAAVVVSACNSGPADSGDTVPGAVSEGEARALDEAASMLDEKRLPEGALPDVDPVAPADATDAAEGNRTPKAK